MMKMNKLNFILFLTTGFFLNTCELPTEEAADGYIFGVVSSIGSSSPVAGVIVSCGGKTYTTGSDGYYIIENISVGGHQLRATKTDYETYSKSVNVMSNGTDENILMVSNVAGASVQGFVRRNSDGTPISGARVMISGMTDYTDATGHYQLPSIPQGNQNIQVYADGYELYSQAFYMYSSDKQIQINLYKSYTQEFSITMDNYWSNFSGTGLNNEYIFTGEYMGVNSLLYFSSNINIPTSSEVTSLVIQFYINDSDYNHTWDWNIAAINENWSELGVTRSSPTCNSVLNAPHVSTSGYYITISIIEAIIHNKNDFLQYGFRMMTKEDRDYNWTVSFPSSENSDTSKRPKIIVTYLY